MIEWLQRWLVTVPPAPDPVDRFVTIRANGNAHFDLAAYLATPEGIERLDRMAARNQGALKRERAAPSDATRT
jgi:hypothetical protein